MLERAAKAAYDAMIQRQIDFFANGHPLFPMSWDAQNEQLREDWRSAVMAALKVYGLTNP
jgi:hypothetical protein